MTQQNLNQIVSQLRFFLSARGLDPFNFEMWSGGVASFGKLRLCGSPACAA